MTQYHVFLKLRDPDNEQAFYWQFFVQAVNTVEARTKTLIYHNTYNTARYWYKADESDIVDIINCDNDVVQVNHWRGTFAATA